MAPPFLLSTIAVDKFVDKLCKRGVSCLSVTFFPIRPFFELFLNLFIIKYLNKNQDPWAFDSQCWNCAYDPGKKCGLFRNVKQNVIIDL
jgi:hypothetical protein